MPVNQLNEDFNDAIETYYPNRSSIASILFKWHAILTIKLLQAKRKAFRGTRSVNERIVEYPCVLRWIQTGERVIDIGCVSSRLPLQLASLGYNVTGVDLRPYPPITHSNFRFVQSDIFQFQPDEPVDTVVAISTIEHFGIEGYRSCPSPLPEWASGPFELMERLRGWLKTNGQILLSVPFGLPRVTPKHRVFDPDLLAEVTRGLERFREAYFRRTSQGWLPSTCEEVAKLDSPSLPANGVVVLDLRMPSRDSGENSSRESARRPNLPQGW